MTRFLVVLIASLVAASCAAVRTNVAVTHTLPAAGSSKTVAIVPYTNTLGASPDFQDNAARLAAQLQSKGYTVVARDGAAQPDYLAFFLYTIDNGTPVNLAVSRPYPPTGSIIAYGPRTTFGPATRRIYRRSVRLEILDRARFNPNAPATFIDASVYSGAVASEGACATMEPVIDPMLMALFADFPGESGRNRTVDVYADTTCGFGWFG